MLFFARRFKSTALSDIDIWHENSKYQKLIDVDFCRKKYKTVSVKLSFNNLRIVLTKKSYKFTRKWTQNMFLVFSGTFGKALTVIGK